MFPERVHKWSDTGVTMALKPSSEIITISGKYENATGGFTSEAFDLQLNPLDMEVFVVQAVNVDYVGNPPTVLAFTGGAIVLKPVAFSTSRPLAQLDLSSSNVFAAAKQTAVLFFDGAAPPNCQTYTLFEDKPSETPDSNLDHIAIIATSNFFIGGTDAANNLGDTAISFKIWGYRARADAATYAALVQSEVLSA